MATPEETTLEGQRTQAGTQTDHMQPPATGVPADLAEKPKEEKKKKKKKVSKAKKRGTGFEGEFRNRGMGRKIRSLAVITNGLGIRILLRRPDDPGRTQ